MKIFLLSDIHFGKSKGSEIFASELKKFLRDVFWPRVDSVNGEKAIIIAGDLFDIRSHIYVNTILDAQRELFDKIAERRIKTYILLGNHDIVYKNSLFPNSIAALVKNHDDIEIISEIKTIPFSQLPITFCPWIVNDEMCDEIKAHSGPLCIGHFEISTFEIAPGHKFDNDKFTLDLVAGFEKVYSGHFHFRSSKENITYIGTPYQQTRSEAGQAKGFFELTINDGKLVDEKFIKNPSLLYQSIEVHEDTDVIFEEFKEKIVDVFPHSNTPQTKINEIVEGLESAGAWSVSVKYPKVDIDDDDVEVSIAQEDFSLNNYVLEYIKNVDWPEGVEQDKLKMLFEYAIREANI
jgi:DNA repair exonuclease SbcCD nuclease subunit